MYCTKHEKRKWYTTSAREDSYVIRHIFEALITCCAAKDAYGHGLVRVVGCCVASVGYAATFPTYLYARYSAVQTTRGRKRSWHWRCEGHHRISYDVPRCQMWEHLRALFRHIFFDVNIDMHNLTLQDKKILFYFVSNIVLRHIGELGIHPLLADALKRIAILILLSGLWHECENSAKTITWLNMRGTRRTSTARIICSVWRT